MSDPAADDVGPSPDHRAGRWAFPLATWVPLAALLLVVQFAARGVDRHLRWWPPQAQLLSGWSQFDGPEYLQIATQGYQQRQLVWFPLYPLLVRGLDVLVGHPLLSAVLVSLAGGVASAVLFWRWSELRLPSPLARRTATLCLLLYPYGWFLYGVVYSDAVFLACALGAFVLAERDRPVLAGLAAALATAGRPSGFAVALGVLVLVLERGGVLRVPARGPDWARRLRIPWQLDRRAVRPALAGPLLASLGLGAYGLYQWIAWGSPVRFLTEQAIYHDQGPASKHKLQYFEAFSQGYDGRHLATTTAQGVLLALAVLSVPAVGRRFGWGYGVFVLGLAVLPAASVSTFMGVGRYLLPAFPAFALLGEHLARHPRRRAVHLVASGLTMVVLAGGFARSWYLT